MVASASAAVIARKEKFRQAAKAKLGGGTRRDVLLGATLMRRRGYLFGNGLQHNYDSDSSDSNGRKEGAVSVHSEEDKDNSFRAQNNLTPQDDEHVSLAEHGCRCSKPLFIIQGRVAPHMESLMPIYTAGVEGGVFDYANLGRKGNSMTHANPCPLSGVAHSDSNARLLIQVTWGERDVRLLDYALEISLEGRVRDLIQLLDVSRRRMFQRLFFHNLKRFSRADQRSCY
jgi:hypothetical protein